MDDWWGQTCTEKFSTSSPSPAGLGRFWPGGMTLNPAAATPGPEHKAPVSTTPRIACAVAPGWSVTVLGTPLCDAGSPI